ncbi:MAG: hypothetical protein JNG88_01770 [Phycisphaerales bacterium]|nr:hypothetical protein [Phycisphaerales bacterium]
MAAVAVGLVGFLPEPNDGAWTADQGVDGERGGARGAAALRRWFARRPCYHLHFTPTGASWLNLVERFFAKITTERIRRGALRACRTWNAKSGPISTNTTAIRNPSAGPPAPT